MTISLLGRDVDDVPIDPTGDGRLISGEGIGQIRIPNPPTDGIDLARMVVFEVSIQSVALGL
ncbi:MULTISPECIES: hypothetical protein [Rhizobium]|uniref:Uncharacterized protein n=2 Tax=Rhizobium TaxID=379 RepID=A0A1C3X8I0_9HYPH|nr:MULTISPECIES: hypothetical protein [Rhizobium]MBB4245552.1 hypothetical protein [Rhizobium tropici]MBB5596836.1 hypothetical protein [Rhizobium tropici]MBB6305673.1 hypothetical protein [Rhizobium leucaenae]MBB6489572.1 hypothetical protein [Rhizobium lusitanum]MBB6495885.1 hypothetical protein [Rhizobium tropici]